MTTAWKSLTVALIGIAAMAWLGMRGGGSHAAGTQDMAAASACADRRPGRCQFDIRYAERAGDFVVVLEDVSF